MSPIKLPRCPECDWALHPCLSGGALDHICKNPKCSKRVLPTPNYSESLPEYGDLFRVERFREWCESGSFIDYDGDGHPVKNGKIDYEILIKPSRINEIPEDATHIMWFNR